MFNRLKFVFNNYSRHLFNNYSRHVNTDVKFIKILRPNIKDNLQTQSDNIQINNKSQIVTICDNYHDNIPRRKILLGNIEYKKEFYVRGLLSILNFQIEKIKDISGLHCVKSINNQKDYINISSQSNFDNIIWEYKLIGQENSIINWNEYFAIILSYNDLSEKFIPINIINMAKKNKIILVFL